MKDRSSRNLIAITVIGLITVTSIFIYRYSLPAKTIENMEFNVSIRGYGYSNNFQFVITRGSMIIHNGGPLDVCLRESEIEITFDNNTYVKLPLKDSILIKDGRSYQYVLAPPDFIIDDEEHLILASIMDYLIDTEIILYSDVVVGGREYSIEKRYSHPIGFIHLPDLRP